ncbi:hypothetical protein ACFXPV_09560 [Streptomyces sp. NPDC059118]
MHRQATLHSRPLRESARTDPPPPPAHTVGAVDSWNWNWYQF